MAVSTSPATGARGAIVVGDETEFGVVVSPTHIIDFTSESLSASENVIESESIRNDRGRRKLIRGNLDVQGDISFEQSTSGLGILLRHALGDGITVENVDGGLHARQRDAAVTAVAAGTDVPATNILVCTEDSDAAFADNGLLTVIYRDGNNDLVSDDNTNSGWAYDSFAGRVETYVTAVDNTATDYDGGGNTEQVVKLTVAQVYDSDGNLVNPDFNPNGGIIQFGPNRTEVPYFEASGTSIWLDPDVALVGDSTTYPNAGNNDVIINVPAFAKRTTGYGSMPVGIGYWVYQYDTAYTDGNGNTAYTHHLERGANLPVGLTVEVDRDAVIFVYSGCKVNTLNLSFETNSIVTGSVSLVAQREYASATLMEDVIPAAGTILVNGEAAHWPSSGTITIGERTGITYSAKSAVDADGNYTLTTDGAGDAAIDRLHVEGTQVDLRTSTQAGTTYEGNTDPLTSFEALVYMSGYYEEVLSGSITLNNNLNTDKYGLGSRYRLQTVEQRAVVEASLTMEFDDGKHYHKFKTAEYFTLEFKCVSEADSSEIGTTGVLSQAYYFLPKCKFNGNTPNIESDSYIVHDMPISAIVDDDYNTTDLVIILVNSQQYDIEGP